MAKKFTTDPVAMKFRFQPAQTRLFKYVQRGAGTYIQLAAPQNLEIGGIRSGKTTGKFMYYVENYCMKYSHCDILVLRRTFAELDSGVIQDFKTHIPEELYTFNQTTRIATFRNGSRIVFGGCVNNLDKDIEKYLGQAYPGILVDECGQFSPAAWQLLYSRNTVNAACEPDEFGNFPVPSISGCTNPIGPYWEYYHTMFVLKEPWEKEEGMRRAKDGSYWVQDAGEWRLVYNPADYAANHTTVLDNPIYIKERDPGIIARLKALPKAKMQKMLLGLMDRVEGQYFDCFSDEQHVVDLREDPDAIIWQDWQPVWVGQDFGVGHWNAIYLFTKGLVRSAIGNDYKLKTICFGEIAPDSIGHTDIELRDLLNAKCYYPRLPVDHPQYDRISGKRARPKAIYFSHEKFSRIMEKHSPADEYSKLLREVGLPSVSRATMDRIGSATFMYNEIKKGKLVILKHCQGIIQAIPSLQRDPDNLDDVLKVNSKADDRYDGFRYGLYGGLNDKQKPQDERDKEAAAKIVDPFARHFYLMKKRAEAGKAKADFVQKDVPFWQTQG